jgi:2-polyprenyl-3-methyl-5-hydroxy-6-metoxy-1,4-benzoquinol methylase
MIDAPQPRTAPTVRREQSYLLDNAWQHARARLSLLESRLDPGTIFLLNRLGIRPGWRCLVVGAGGGSITEWLCQQTGPEGHVVATDIDTRFIDALDYPNLEVRRHDIVADELKTV